jgi:hypothetical protein
MVNPFKIPFKEVEISKKKFVSVLFFGLFIFLFLFIFQPFGLAQLTTIQKLFVTFGFGLVTSFVLTVFKYLLDPLVIRANWTLGKSILWGLLIACSIGVANYFYISIIFPQQFFIRYIFTFMITAVLVGIIPVSISYIVAINRMYRTALKNAAIVPEEVLWENEVIIKAGNPKNELRLDPRNIIYICSNDNYVTVVSIKGDIPVKTTIRGTLKSTESELKKNSRFLRCHKCYIINLDYVDRISGHNQNMKVRLLNSGIDIPVSRSKASHINKNIKTS